MAGPGRASCVPCACRKESWPAGRAFAHGTAGSGAARPPGQPTTQAGLGVRYFYETFNDKDDFAAQVYDWVIADIAATTQAAVAAAPPREQSRAAMANIVRTIAADQRVGRLVFGSWDDKAGMCGSVGDIVRHPKLNHSPQVLGGVEAATSSAMLRDFFSERRGQGSG